MNKRLSNPDVCSHIWKPVPSLKPYMAANPPKMCSQIWPQIFHHFWLQNICSHIWPQISNLIWLQISHFIWLHIFEAIFGCKLTLNGCKRLQSFFTSISCLCKKKDCYRAQMSRVSWQYLKRPIFPTGQKLFEDSTSSVHSNLSRYGLYYSFLSLLFDKDHLKLDSYSKIEEKRQGKKITRLK